MAIDKQWAQNQLRHARNSYLISLAGIRLINSDALDTLAGRIVLIAPTGIVFDPEASDRQGKRFELEFDQLISSRDDTPTDFDYDLETNYRFARRTLVKESFEYAKAYANNNGKAAAFEGASWYHFFRLIRNALSHDFHFRFSEADKTRLPIVWDGRTIDASMDGAELTILDPYLAVAIASHLESFVDAN